MPLLEPEKGENDLLIETGKQANAFLNGTLQIRDVVERILKKQPGTARFLLIVDQWEELYTLAKSESQAGRGDKEQSSRQRKHTVKTLYRWPAGCQRSRCFNSGDHAARRFYGPSDFLPPLVRPSAKCTNQFRPNEA